MSHVLLVECHWNKSTTFIRQSISEIIDNFRFHNQTLSQEAENLKMSIFDFANEQRKLPIWRWKIRTLKKFQVSKAKKKVENYQRWKVETIGNFHVASSQDQFSTFHRKYLEWMKFNDKQKIAQSRQPLIIIIIDDRLISSSQLLSAAIRSFSLCPLEESSVDRLRSIAKVTFFMQLIEIG